MIKGQSFKNLKFVHGLSHPIHLLRFNTDDFLSSNLIYSLTNTAGATKSQPILPAVVEAFGVAYVAVSVMCIKSIGIPSSLLATLMKVIPARHYKLFIETTRKQIWQKLALIFHKMRKSFCKSHLYHFCIQSLTQFHTTSCQENSAI